MKHSNQTLTLTALIASLILGIVAGPISASQKKYEVISETVNIYLEPSPQSTIIATLEKGTLLIQSSSKKFKKSWNYIYFTSKKSGKTKSGYVNDPQVKKLIKYTRSFILKSGIQKRA